MSAGSYCGPFNGGRVQSMDDLDGVLGRTGEEVMLRGGIEYGGIEGVRPRPDVGLLAGMSIDGTCGLWYRSGCGRVGTGSGCLFGALLSASGLFLGVT